MPRLRDGKVLPGADERHRPRCLRWSGLRPIRPAKFLRQNRRFPIAKATGRVHSPPGQQRRPVQQIFRMEKRLRIDTKTVEWLVRFVCSSGNIGQQV